MSYFNFIIILILVTIFFGGLSLLITKKGIRFFFVILFLGFGSLTLWSLISHNNEINRVEKKKEGVYKINLDSTNFKSYNKELYKDLTISLNEDNTFQLSMDVPFVLSNSGTWDYNDDGEMGMTKLNLKDGGEIYILVANGVLQMDNPIPKQGLEQINSISFKKVNN